MTKKKFHQILPNFSQRDAVGTDTLLIQKFLCDLGFQSEIFYEVHGDPELAAPLDKLQPYLNATDTTLMFHFSIGSEFPSQFSQLSNKKVVRYHNITPPDFFCAPGEIHIRNACSWGRQQIPMLAIFADLVIGDSAYNCQEFSAYSQVPTCVAPIFRDYEKLKNLPDQANVKAALKNAGKPVLFFVGRICPNKAQHDLLKLIALYKSTFEEPVGLILAGSFFSQSFKLEIENYARYLNLSVSSDLKDLYSHDVVISGSITDEELASLYRHSDLFCSLSEHEGFGVPLVEAMSFGLPVLAHRSSAVPETLGSGGMLVDKGSWRELLQAMRAILRDQGQRRLIANAGLKRASELSLVKARESLQGILESHHLL